MSDNGHPMTGTATVAPDDERISEALAAGLLGIDAARRVGWAKAFEALRRVEGLEEEVRILRDEQRQLRRAYSRILGFINNISCPRSPIFNDEIALHTRAEKSFRRQDAWLIGVKRAAEHQALAQQWGENEFALRRIRQIFSQAAFGHVAHVARAAGHSCAVAAEQDGAVGFRARCSCGETELFETDLKAFKWREFHDFAVMGLGTESFRQAMKVARDSWIETHMPDISDGCDEIFDAARQAAHDAVDAYIRDLGQP